jgi:hypothetical protein
VALALLLSACGGAPPPIPTPPAVTAPPAVLVPAPSTPVPTPTPPVSVATRPPTAQPEPTPTPYTVRVASTASGAIYLYHSPTTGDRIQSYPEGTPLLVVGSDVEGDGLTWHSVRAPDGTEGFIPVGDTVPEAQ